MPQLVTLSDVKDYLSVDGTDDDALLTGLIDGVEEYVTRRCDATQLIQGPRTDHADGGTDVLILPAAPVQEVTEVVDATTPGALPVPADQYRLPSGDDGLLVKTTGTWAAGRGRWRVTYTAGPDTVPDDVALAVTLLVQTVYANRGTAGGSIVEERIGDYAYKLAQTDAGGGAADTVDKLLDPYQDVTL